MVGQNKKGGCVAEQIDLQSLPVSTYPQVKVLLDVNAIFLIGF